MSESIGQWVKIKELTPWEENPRDNQAAIDEVAKSIKRFGFASPIIARTADKMIIAGHTRFEAAKKLGLKSVPVRFMDLDMNDAQLLALADNKMGEIADWDYEQLRTVIHSMNNQDLDLSNLGWSEFEIENLSLEIETGENNADEEWVDMPEYQHDDKTSAFSIKIHFANKEDLDAFSEIVNQTITEKTVSIWYPKQEKFENYQDRY